MDEIKKRCPCDDCSGVENCPLKAVRVAVEGILEAWDKLVEANSDYHELDKEVTELGGAIQVALDAMEG